MKGLILKIGISILELKLLEGSTIFKSMTIVIQWKINYDSCLMFENIATMKYSGKHVFHELKLRQWQEDCMMLIFHNSTILAVTLEHSIQNT